MQKPISVRFLILFLLYPRYNLMYNPSMEYKVLIVDDEISICELLSTELELDGYETKCAYDGAAALEAFASFKPDIILLDIMLPVFSGYEVLERINSVSDVPVIMLTARDATEDIVEGLGKGADDYITKPFETSELLARINALLRRYKPDRSLRDEQVNGPMRVIPSAQAVYLEDKPVKLTVTEFQLLQIFLNNRSKVLSRKDIATLLGEPDYDENTRAIDMHIQRLRRKLSEASSLRFIETVHGLGYKMRDFDESKVQR